MDDDDNRWESSWTMVQEFDKNWTGSQVICTWALFRTLFITYMVLYWHTSNLFGLMMVLPKILILLVTKNIITLQIYRNWWTGEPVKHNNETIHTRGRVWMS